jgi:hypothetical protein
VIAQTKLITVIEPDKPTPQVPEKELDKSGRSRDGPDPKQVPAPQAEVLEAERSSPGEAHKLDAIDAGQTRAARIDYVDSVR